MDTGFDLSLVDWNNPHVKHLFEHVQARFEQEKKMREQQDERIGELEESLRQRDERIRQLEEELKKAQGAPSAPRPKKKLRSYNTRQFKNYPTTRSDTSKRSLAIRNPRLPVSRYMLLDVQYCPTCGTVLPNTGSSYSRDVIDVVDGMACRTRYTVNRRYCGNCRMQRSAQVPGVLAGQMYGNNLMAQVTFMRCMGLSFGNIQMIFETICGLHVAKFSLVHICKTTAQELRPVYDTIHAEILLSPVICGDETGWFFDGKNWWIWTFVTPHAVFFHFAPTRSMLVPEAILRYYMGIVLSDSYSCWNSVGGDHQRCLLHYYRDMYATRDKNDSAEFKELFDRLHAILDNVIVEWEAKRRSMGDANIMVAYNLRSMLRDLANKKYTDLDCVRYAKRLKREGDQLVTCLIRDIDYHNNKSELSLRRLALTRKTSYGSRSELGIFTTETLSTIYSTCAMRGVNMYHFVRDFLDGKTDKIPMRKMTLPAKAIACSA